MTIQCTQYNPYPTIYTQYPSKREEVIAHKACRESVPHLMPAAALPAAAPQLNTADPLARAPVAKVTRIKRNSTACVPEVVVRISCPDVPGTL